MDIDFNYNKENFSLGDVFDTVGDVAGDIAGGYVGVLGDVAGGAISGAIDATGSIAKALTGSGGSSASSTDSSGMSMFVNMNPTMLKTLLSKLIPANADNIDVNTASGRNIIYNIIEYAYYLLDNPDYQDDPNNTDDPLNDLGIYEYDPIDPSIISSATGFLKNLFPVLDLSNVEHRRIAYADIEIYLQEAIDVSNPDTIQEQITRVFETILTPIDTNKTTVDLITDVDYRQKVYEEMERQLNTVSGSRAKRRIVAFLTQIFPLKDITNLIDRTDMYNKLENVFRQGTTVKVVGSLPLPGYDQPINDKLGMHDTQINELEGSIDGMNDKIGIHTNFIYNQYNDLIDIIDVLHNHIDESSMNVDNKLTTTLNEVTHGLTGMSDYVGEQAGELNERLEKTVKQANDKVNSGMTGIVSYLDDYSEKLNTKLNTTDTLISKVDLKLQKDFKHILDTVNTESAKNSILYDEILSELKLNKHDIDDDLNNVKTLLDKFKVITEQTGAEVYHSINEMETNNSITIDTVHELSDKVSQQTSALDAIKLQVFDGFNKSVQKNEYENTVNNIIELDTQNKQLHDEINSLEIEMSDYTEKIKNVNSMVEENIPILTNTLTRFSSEVGNQYDKLEDDVIAINRSLYETKKNIDETYGNRIQNNSNYINISKIIIVLIFCAMLYVAFTIYGNKQSNPETSSKGGRAFHRFFAYDHTSSPEPLRR